MELGASIYYNNGNGIWKSGRLESIKNDEIHVIDNQDHIESVTRDMIVSRNEDDDCSNLGNMSYLHNPGIICALEDRFHRGNPYTDANGMLIAVNPFKTYEHLYAPDAKLAYSRDTQGMEPHVYKVSSNAHRSLSNTQKSQTILISGESGAGKTETTKIVIDHLASISGDAAKSPNIDHIVLSGLVLEAFGNAKTVRNNNSSRFGKFVSLQYQNNSVCGAGIKTYLLEKCRIVTQNTLECNYHVFYQLVNGSLDESTAKKYALSSKDFRYVPRSSFTNPEFHNIGEITRNALNAIGISKGNQFDSLLEMLVCILYIGNLAIQQLSDEECRLDEDESFQIVSRILGVQNSEVLSKTICERTVTVANESYVVKLDVAQSQANMDALAKALYCWCFDWIVTEINENIKSLSEAPLSISVLDIFGFEVFEDNCLEQLCINYANERLQQVFNETVLKEVQLEYQREGIPWEPIEYNDGMNVLQLIHGKTKSVFSLLHEECTRPKGKPHEFVSKLVSQNDELLKSKVIASHKFEPERFVITHFAAPVTYCAKHFLSKNLDKLHVDMRNLLENHCSSSFLSLLMSKQSTSSDTRGITIQFRNQLTDLVNTIQSTDVQFIRCIKPNTTCSSTEFDQPMVAIQLQFSGVLEALRISRAGYPDKLTYTAALKKWGGFKSLAMNDENGAQQKDLVIHRLESLAPNVAAYTAGKTYIYFRTGCMDLIDQAYESNIANFVIAIQKTVRRFMAMVEYRRTIRAICKMQSIVRMFSCATAFDRMKTRVATMQRAVRVFHSKKLSSNLRRQRAVTKIQCRIRSWRPRTEFIQCRKACVEIQSIIRMRQQQLRFARIKAEIEESKSKAFLEAKVLSLESELQELRARFEEQALTHDKHTRLYKQACKKLKGENEMLKQQQQASHTTSHEEELRVLRKQLEQQAEDYAKESKLYKAAYRKLKRENQLLKQAHTETSVSASVMTDAKEKAVIPPQVISKEKEAKHVPLQMAKENVNMPPNVPKMKRATKQRTRSRNESDLDDEGDIIDSIVDGLKYSGQSLMSAVRNLGNYVLDDQPNESVNAKKRTPVKTVFLNKQRRATHHSSNVAQVSEFNLSDDGPNENPSARYRNVDKRRETN